MSMLMATCKIFLLHTWLHCYCWPLAPREKDDARIDLRIYVYTKKICSP